jgi:uncharacterized protein
MAQSPETYLAMNSSFLILHGIENHRPPEHWQFWLAARLRERGHLVLYPGLPDPDGPVYDVWADCVQDLLTELVGAERVVICHSLACLLWFRIAGELGEEHRVDRLLLVSPPASDRVPKAGASFLLDGFDAPAVLGSVRGEIRIACSDADPYNPEGAQQLYGSQLGITADVFPGAGHITPESGYGPWPYAEAWCLDTRRRR